MLDINKLIVDLFCGGGGASQGIKEATEREPDIAIDYEPLAIKTHAANHPDTKHFCADVMEIDPVEVCCDRKVGLLWLSPPCTDFSRAKGNVMVSARIRAMANVALIWAEAVRPDMIFMENVPEFKFWGPLMEPNVDISRPDPRYIGLLYRQFMKKLRALGYVIEENEFNCADFGAPTLRRRYFMIARCDGKPIRWPKPTHGDGTKNPHLTAAICIDWSIPCRSIFGREKELADNTKKRIFAGIERYVINDKDPFLVQVAHGDHADRPGFRGQSIRKPMGVITGSRTHAIVAPTLAKIGERHMRGNRRLNKPYDTVMPTQRAALVAPTLVRMGHGDKQWNSTKKPLNTVRTGGNHHALVSAFLAKNYTGIVGCPLEQPIGSVTAKDHHSLVTATITAAHVTKPPDVVCANASNHALVTAFFTKYYGEGSISQQLREPLHTVVTRAGALLMTGAPAGEDWVIVDIGLRMLQPHELAMAQGFPATYIFPGTLAQQTARIGNAVPPPMARALVAANIAA